MSDAPERIWATFEPHESGKGHPHTFATAMKTKGREYVRADKLEELAAENNTLKDVIDEMRPVWADASIVGCLDTALAGLWKLLGAQHQTEACQKLRALLDSAEAAEKERDEYKRLYQSASRGNENLKRKVAAERQAGARVKPLAWNGVYAHGVGITYRVTKWEDEGFILEKKEGSSITKSFHKTKQGARDFAQTDYERDILSAQATDNAGGGDAER